MYGRAYSEVHAFLHGLGGSMAWRPGGHGGGGDWVLQLRGREAIVGIHSRKVGVLDKLYILKPGAKPPEQWDDDAWEAALVPDAFWILVGNLEWRPTR